MTTVAETIYIVTTGTARGREHRAVHGPDGHLAIKLSRHDSNGSGTNLALFSAVGGAACLDNATGLAALRLRLVPSEGNAIDAEFDLSIVDGVHSLRACLNLRLPGMTPDLVRRLADAAYRTCRHPGASDGETHVVIDEALAP